MTVSEAGQHWTMLMDSRGEVQIAWANDDNMQPRKGKRLQRQERQYVIVVRVCGLTSVSCAANCLAWVILWEICNLPTRISVSLGNAGLPSQPGTVCEEGGHGFLLLLSSFTTVLSIQLSLLPLFSTVFFNIFYSTFSNTSEVVGLLSIDFFMNCCFSLLLYFCIYLDHSHRPALPWNTINNLLNP